MPGRGIEKMADGISIDSKSNTAKAVKTPKPDQLGKMDHIETSQNTTVRQVALSEMHDSNSGT